MTESEPPNPLQGLYSEPPNPLQGFILNKAGAKPPPYNKFFPISPLEGDLGGLDDQGN